MASPSDQGYTLLPPDPGIINPALALDAALAPVVTYGPPLQRPFGKGWAFDFLTGQFIRHGTSPAEAFGLDELRVWVEKTLRTAQLAHPIYDDSYGMEDPFFLISTLDTSELEDEYEERVTKALLVHDRIRSVDDFQFSYTPTDDALYVAFAVSTTDTPGQSFQVSAIQFGGAS